MRFDRSDPIRQRNNIPVICSGYAFKILAFLVRIALRICHPVIRIRGKENIPSQGAVLCANHSSFSDPLWVIAYGGLCKLPRTMAKKELFHNPILSKLFAYLGAFPVDRGNTDIAAIKTSMQTLKDGNKLLIFPEGTRVRKGKEVTPHSGAVLIAHRMGAPIVPIYLSQKKGLFRPIDLIIGKAYFTDFGGTKPDATQLDLSAHEMINTIYSMGELL